MTTPSSETQTDTPSDVDAIQAEIEQTREQLGQTVEALSARLDVKARVKQRIADTKERAVDAATDDGGSVKPVVPAAALLVVAAVVALLVLRKRQR